MEDILAYLDFIIIGAILAAVITYLLTLGKGRAVTLLIATYIGAFTVRLIPEIYLLSTSVNLYKQDLQSVTLLALVIILIYLLLLRNGFFEPYVETEQWESVVFAVVTVGIFLYAASYVLMPSTLEVISPALQAAFYDSPFTFIWPIAPLVAILLVRGK